MKHLKPNFMNFVPGHTARTLVSDTKFPPLGKPIFSGPLLSRGLCRKNQSYPPSNIKFSKRKIQLHKFETVKKVLF